MTSNEDYKTRQEDEKQAIISIFDQVQDLREEDAWKVYRSPELLIPCVPQSSDSVGAVSESHVTINLKIKLPETYPDQLPSIYLRDVVGLSDKCVKELHKQLVNQAKQLRGQEMMFDLISMTQSYLYAHNKPPAMSFYDEMIERQQRADEEKTRQEIEAERLEDLEVEAEIVRQREIMKQESQRKREARKISENERKTPNTSTVKPENTLNTPCNTEEHNKILQIDFNMMGRDDFSVIRGRCIRHNAHSVTYTALNELTGNFLQVDTWTFSTSLKSKVERKTNYEKCLTMVTALLKESVKLFKLEHECIVSYLSYHVEYKLNEQIQVTILTDSTPNLSLPDLLELVGSENLPVIQSTTQQLLNCIKYLHDNNIIHRNLTPYCIYVDRDSVKLSGYDVYRKLDDIHTATISGQLDTVLATPKRAQKEDIFKLGLIILYMVTKAYDCEERLPIIPKHTNTTLSDLINKCIIADEKRRWTAERLLEHEFITQTKHQYNNTTDLAAEQVSDENNQFSDGSDDEDHPAQFNSMSAVCRLNNEFTVIDLIGSGGFGQVLKVRNKLDGRLYAIKRITLNPKSKVFNKKITREVKLLSRLNHENVVRYYNSWIEASNEPVLNEESSFTTTTTSDQIKHSELNNVNNQSDSLERFAPLLPEVSIAWSIGGESDVAGDDESSSDEEGFFNTGYRRKLDSESEDIMFEDSDEKSRQDEPFSSPDAESERPVLNVTETNRPLALQYMYIQMEYCEKNTLRQVIDQGLYQDEPRLWRLFREIIEGLVHIHEQGMIHRDLKPVNIFLDSNDRVKIGDFGLATKAVVAKLDGGSSKLQSDGLSAGLSSKLSVGISMSMGDGKHTGHVGTTLYISPEIIQPSTAKTAYTQKVDIYSLGVIFFEMCYRPLTTQMEREHILRNVRSPEIIFPKDFTSQDKPKHVAILEWLLAHQSEKRPTSQELLQSNLLPPAEIEEEELYDIIRSTIEAPESRGYKKLLTTIFNQKITRTFDVGYDLDRQNKELSSRSLICRELCKKRLTRVFDRHGAVNLTIPQILPKLAGYEKTERNVVMMDHAGNLVSLPYDLRIPFARYAARNEISTLKRFCINRVFHEKKPFGSQPTEIYLTGFDIISPHTESFLADAESFCVIQDILDDFPLLRDKGYKIYINHCDLMKGILLHCGIPEKLHVTLYDALCERNERTKDESLSVRLNHTEISDTSANQLSEFIELKGSLKSVTEYLNRIRKASDIAASLVKKALHEIEAIITYSQSMNKRLKYEINVGYLQNMNSCSGITFQIGVEIKKRGYDVLDVIGAGFRYDQLLRYYSRKRTDPVTSKAIGFSMNYDRLCQSVMRELKGRPIPACDVLILLTGKPSSDKEKLHIAREFWDNDISAHIHHDTSSNAFDFESLVTLCQDSGISHLLTFNDSDLSTVKLKFIDREGSNHDKKIKTDEVVKFIKERLDNTQNTSRQFRLTDGKLPCHKSDSKTDDVTKSERQKKDEPSTVTSLPLTIMFNNPPKTGLMKKKNKVESIIVSNIAQTVLSKLKKAAECEVIAVETHCTDVKLLSDVCMDSKDEHEFELNATHLLNRMDSAGSKKHMIKYLEKIKQMLYTGTRAAVLVIYGISDNSYRVVFT